METLGIDTTIKKYNRTHPAPSFPRLKIIIWSFFLSRRLNSIYPLLPSLPSLSPSFPPSPPSRPPSLSPALPPFLPSRPSPPSLSPSLPPSLSPLPYCVSLLLQGVGWMTIIILLIQGFLMSSRFMYVLLQEQILTSISHFSVRVC